MYVKVNNNKVRVRTKLSQYLLDMGLTNDNTRRNLNYLALSYSLGGDYLDVLPDLANMIKAIIRANPCINSIEQITLYIECSDILAPIAHLTEIAVVTAREVDFNKYKVNDISKQSRNFYMEHYHATTNSDIDLKQITTSFCYQA